MELIPWITQLSVTAYSSRHDIVREMPEVALREKSTCSVKGMYRVDLNDSRSGPLVHNFIHRNPELKPVIGKTIGNARVKETTYICTVDALKVWFDAYNQEVQVQDGDVLFENVYN